MTRRNRSKERRAIYKGFAVVFLIHLILGLYHIALSERVKESPQEKARMERAVLMAGEESTRRAIQEVGR